MAGPQPERIELSDKARQDLQKLAARHKTGQQKAQRARIILKAAKGKNNAEIARELQQSIDMVRLWRRRWLELEPLALEDLSVDERLEDLPRAGAPPRLTVDQLCLIEQLACEAPQKAGRPISQWTNREIADEKIADINDLYQTAQEQAERGEATVSTDEMTGVQALERQHPDLPMQPGQVLRREFEYVRHGTLSFIVNFEVASGQVGQVSAGPTRNEADFLAHIQRTVKANPRIGQWHFILDEPD